MPSRCPSASLATCSRSPGREPDDRASLRCVSDFPPHDRPLKPPVPLATCTGTCFGRSGEKRGRSLYSRRSDVKLLSVLLVAAAALSLALSAPAIAGGLSAAPADLVTQLPRSYDEFIRRWTGLIQAVGEGGGQKTECMQYLCTTSWVDADDSEIVQAYPSPSITVAYFA
jgi:hypothetical protein